MIALPEWDLSDFYNSPEDAAIEKDLAGAAAAAKSFAEKFQGELDQLSGEELGDAISDYEALDETLSAIMSYAQLLFATNADDAQVAAFYQNMNERCTDITSDVLFFELELNRVDDETMKAQLASPKAAKYQSWIDANRVMKPYQLSDELEKLLHEKSVAGRSAWSRLFDETMTGLRFDIDGKEFTESDVLSQLSDADGEVRKKAAKAFGKGLGDNARLFALITNTLAKDKEIEDQWRKLPRPVSRRNLSNQVEDEVVDALASAVKDNYENLAHRYYRIKAGWMERDVLDYWDRNAPLPDADDQKIEWDRAKTIVLDSYNAFDPALGRLVQKFFDNPWIDVGPKAGKNSGAFSHPTVPRVHPYVLLNYHGKTRDVMTLAHELGHGAHQILAAPQGHFLSNTPLTLAETASVFGEMLTFRAMLNGETDAAKRRILLAGKVEDMLNTVVRQVAFFDFEVRVHDERKNGEISADRLGEIWLAVQRESLGPVFRFDDDYAHYWSYIPHFIHSPFYVYAYAFGDCLVNSLYDVFLGGHDGFQEKYLDMLRAGGTLRHKELLAPFGLDASDPEFWQRGLKVVAGFVDELEAGG